MPPALAEPSTTPLPASPAALRAALLAWYDRARRDLPWRAAPGRQADSYAVLVSEVMLQQTTVATVRPRFAAFMARFATLDALAAAPLEAVLHAWQGLGYYRRARLLHGCAEAVVRHHGGRLPADLAKLRALPGIGDYTAAAVAAIAFGLPAVPVDGNVERVLGRLLATTTPLLAGRRAITAAAAALKSPERAADLAQAVMELGALVCTPRAPACLACPWRVWCRAAASGTPEAYPPRAVRPERPVRHAVAFLLERPDGAILFRRRPLDGLLGGMAELPSTAWLPEPPGAAAVAAAAPAAADWRPLPGIVRHGFTHFELRFSLLLARNGQGPADGLWARPDGLGELALPTMTLHLLRHAGIAARRGSGAPHVLQVQRPAPGCNGDEVEALPQTGELWPALEEEAGGARDPHLLPPAHRLEREAGTVAALDLDEQDEVTATRDQVDLTQGAGKAAGEDAVAGKAQDEGSRHLGTPAGPLAILPPGAHRPRRPSTRR